MIGQPSSCPSEATISALAVRVKPPRHIGAPRTLSADRTSRKGGASRTGLSREESRGIELKSFRTFQQQFQSDGKRKSQAKALCRQPGLRPPTLPLAQ